MGEAKHTEIVFLLFLLTRKGRVYVEFFRDTENSRECILACSSYNHEAGKNIAFHSDTIVLGGF